MRREVRILLQKAIDSLILLVECFNRPSNQGRAEVVLILLDHSFELFLKAAILHKGGRIREPRARETYGFDHCVRKCLSDKQVKFLKPDQAVLLRIINNLRDVAMHHILSISEQQLYLNTQAGITLFDDILTEVFGKYLADYLPERVLPVSAKPPTDLVVLMDEEFHQIRNLVVPKRRQQSEAKARLRAIVAMDNAMQDREGQLSDGHLRKLLKRVAEGEDWSGIFPGVASLKLNTSGTGLSFNIRITKKRGLPIKLVKEGEAPVATVAVKRVNELDYYSLGFRDLSRHLSKDFSDIKGNRLLAVIKELGVRDNPEFYKEVYIGKSRFRRYSKKALSLLREKLPELDVGKLWKKHRKKLV